MNHSFRLFDIPSNVYFCGCPLTFGLVSTTYMKFDLGLALRTACSICSSSTHRALNPASGWLHLVTAAWKHKKMDRIHSLFIEIWQWSWLELLCLIICCMLCSESWQGTHDWKKLLQAICWILVWCVDCTRRGWLVLGSTSCRISDFTDWKCTI